MANLRYRATPPTNINGDLVDGLTDIAGRQIVVIEGSITTSLPSTAAVTSVNDTATSTTLIAANASAKERVIQNDSTSTLYVKFGTTASAVDYTVKLAQDDVLTTQYTGRIDGIWSSDASGAAKITELT